LAGPGIGCLNKRRMEEKIRRGGNSADITIHEWLHTLQGQKINGRVLPSPDENGRYGFSTPDGQGPDGVDVWHKWYEFVLRWE
jgi:hypothetical protein